MNTDFCADQGDFKAFHQHLQKKVADAASSYYAALEAVKKADEAWRESCRTIVKARQDYRNGLNVDGLQEWVASRQKC